MNQVSIVEKINTDIKLELQNVEAQKALLSTTFKGFTEPLMRQALTEGMLRGFTFKDFLEKNIYAIKYGDGYSLITAIDNNRKIGMRSGVVGVGKPVYQVEDGKIISCSIVIKKKINDYIGDFEAEVFFDEYYTKGKEWNGKYTPSMWDKKPRTMIAKVAEMHALRKACPEELAQSYIEEEMTREAVVTVPQKPTNIKVHIMSQLRELGIDIENKTEVAPAIERLTNMKPEDANFEEISNRLSILIEDKNANPNI